jgi:hypothetical protein
MVCKKTINNPFDFDKRYHIAKMKANVKKLTEKD